MAGFCTLIDKMLKDEDEAPSGYTELQIAATEEGINVDNQLRLIIQDENRHYATLSEMKKRYCGGK
jgi:rubrerythrin